MSFFDGIRTEEKMEMLFHLLSLKPESALHLLELAGLEELVLTSVNGKQKTSSRVYARGNCALRHAHKGKQTWRCRIIMCSVFGSCCGALKPM